MARGTFGQRFQFLHGRRFADHEQLNQIPDLAEQGERFVFSAAIHLLSSCLTVNRGDVVINTPTRPLVGSNLTLNAHE
jgi:hypothetical protein